MKSIALRRALLGAALCLAPSGAFADNVPAPAAAMSAAAAPALTTAQIDAIIMQAGFTPVGDPKQKGTMIGSLARLGNNAFIVTIDATTGKFVDAKPADIALPPLAPPPAAAPPMAPPAMAAAPATAAPAPVARAATPPAIPFSPVKQAADLARSKGFKVLSFQHRSDDTFLVAQRGNALFMLKINDKGQLLSTTPIRHGDNDRD